MQLKVKKLRHGAHMPTRATDGSAGMDLCVLCDEAGITVAPMERKLLPTGLAFELPDKNTVALVFARSGLALNSGLAMANGVGVIDSDYRGESMVPVVNLSAEPITLRDGDRIAQMLVMPVLLPDITLCDTLSDTGRGAGGFGSTGVK